MSASDLMFSARNLHVGIEGRTLCAALDIDIVGGELLAIVQAATASASLPC